MKINMLTFLTFIFIFLQIGSFAQDDIHRQWAPKPPMGWNSYDAYHGAITEKQLRSCIGVLAKKYLPVGYESVVVDFCWFNPGPKGWDPDHWKTFSISQEWHEDGTFSPTLQMDGYGRLLPAVNRFPSAANGKGFKALADLVHSKGMKFGIHIIRGIPRQAVALNTPILGTKYHAKDVIHYSPKSWTNTMYMVDINKPGAQEYYNSIFKLYAEWGVDYVKADDMMKPFYHAGEIEMMHKAILNSGRPMVLSLSWGEAQLSYARHLSANANLWRMSGDFWDHWEQIAHMFDLTANWVPFNGNGCWPDADMLPIGRLCLSGYPSGKKPEHLTNLSDDEIKTMMSLWCIARSPLMWGGDPLSTPAKYEKYLLNKEVLNVDQNSLNNHQVYYLHNTRIWIADVPNSDDKYLAMFNLSDKDKQVDFDFFWEKLSGKYRVRDLWQKTNMEIADGKVTRDLPAHASALLRLSKLKNLDQ